MSARPTMGVLAFALVAFALMIALDAGAIAAPAASLPPLLGSARQATVTVSATVLPTIAASFDEGGVIVSANVPWQVRADMPDGGRFTECGDPTDGHAVTLPDGATGVEVCAR